MTHESLIDRLTEDLKPVRRRRPGMDIAVIAVICVVELALLFAVGMARPDMAALIRHPTFWWRLASLAAIGGISGSFAILSFSPVYAPRRGLRWVAATVLICLISGLLIFGGQIGAATLIHRLDWTDGVQCAAKIIALSMPPLFGLGVLMRRGAPTDTRTTALLAGLAAAAWGAFIFVFACPFDDPIYIAVWYSVGCGIVTAISRTTLARLTRW